MPVNPVPNGPSTSVLAYNGDSPRGWNDPPTFAFSKSSGSRPKLDLRKRVSHHQALHGTQTPSFNPSSPTTYGVNGGNEVSDRMASLSMQSSPVTTGNVSTVPPSVTPPQQPKMMHNHHVSTPPVALYTPSQTSTTHGQGLDHRSHSLPEIYMPTVVPNMHYVEPVSTPDINAASSNINPNPQQTMQPQGFLGQPLFALKDHSFEPVKTHNDSGVRSTAEIGHHLDDHSDQSSQIFHPVPQHVSNGIHNAAPPVGHITPPMGTTQHGRVSPFSKHARAISPHPSIPVAPPSNPAMTLPPSCHPAMMVTQSSNPVMAVPTMAVTSSLGHSTGMSVTSTSSLHGGIGHGISTNPPPVSHLTPHQPHVSPIPPIIPTLPVATSTPSQPSTGMKPGSLSASSTPRCLSPEEDNTDGLNDEEGLKATIDALNDVIQKYNLQKRITDDIARKLTVMSKMWREGKLGKTVKSRMIKLAKALDDGNGEEAHHIHVSIIVDHVAEVNQWMVAVKRLISVVRNDTAKTS